MQSYTLGIDIGGTKIALGALSNAFHLLARREFPYDPARTAEDTFARLAAQIRDCLSDAGVKAAAVTHVGVGLPGVLSPDRRSLRFAPNAALFNAFPLYDALQSLFPGAALRMENDANAACLAESRLGAGQGFRNMLYATISTGIGCGLILDGKLYRGSRFSAGEIGHMRIYPGGEACGCGGRGCAEAYAGGANYPRRIRRRIDAGEQTAMTALAAEHGGAIDGRVLSAALGLGDPMAREVFGEICAALGLLFYNINKLLDLDAFVLGGGLTNLGEPLFCGVRREYAALCTPMDDPAGGRFLPAHFSSAEIGIFGAAMAAHPA